MSTRLVDLVLSSGHFDEDPVGRVEHLVAQAARIALAAQRLAQDLDHFADRQPASSVRWRAQAGEPRLLVAQKAEFIGALAAEPAQPEPASPWRLGA